MSTNQSTLVQYVRQTLTRGGLSSILYATLMSLFGIGLFAYQGEAFAQWGVVGLFVFLIIGLAAIWLWIWRALTFPLKSVEQVEGALHNAITGFDAPAVVDESVEQYGSLGRNYNVIVRNYTVNFT